MRRDAAGAPTCTYGHEHHDDPNAVNHLFGPPGAWFGAPGQEVSYPWQTVNAATGAPENQAKHEGYKWHVREAPQCAITPWQKGCVLAYRAQVHARGDASDQTTRFHSFSLEALVEHQGVRGLVRHGGHIDTGHLLLLVDGGDGGVCPGIPQDPPGFTCGASPKRESGSEGVPAPHAAHGVDLVNWYAGHQVTTVQPRIEPWGPIDYRDPAAQRYYGPDRSNNSRGRVENLNVNLEMPWVRAHRDARGLVQIDGHTDRHGAPTQGCSAPGADCVPLIVADAPDVQYGWRGPGLDPEREYDVPGPNGESRIRFPN